jgi:hypothetical protein
MGGSDHVFLYRHRALHKDLIRARLKAAGERIGVHVTPHRLRHTTATQLLNAGCRVTSIQKLLGHRRLNSTMVYARVHDRTVAGDYYAAMDQIEQGLDLLAGPAPTPAEGTPDYLLSLVDTLQAGPLNEAQQETIQALRLAVLTLSEPAAHPETNGTSARVPPSNF